VAEFDLIVVYCEEAVVRGGDEFLIEIGCGFLVPDADGPAAGHRPANQKGEEKQEGEAAEDGAGAAEH